ncbi:MAG: nucleotidyltransferase [Bacteroidales bacterium]|nr:nucleotidyltransferase [Bacteroidales bacterium]
MKPTLLILAAGMGSRYGGLKQLDHLGPNGETIMDYSVNDAIAAGYGKVVFVIRKSMEDDFKQFILSKYCDKIATDYVFQELDALPNGFTLNPERVKPYGTAHAILMAKDAIHEPFTVINADDFYGKNSFKTMAQFLQQEQDTECPQFSMVGYQLRNTLSEHGSVSRGVCQTDDQHNLLSITEMTKISRTENGIQNIDDNGITNLAENTVVSMNFWGFTPYFFDCLQDMFIDFLKKNNDNPKSEFQIPTVVNHFLQNKTADIKVLVTDAQWFGVTYKEDRPIVVEKLKNLQ